MTIYFEDLKVGDHFKMPSGEQYTKKSSRTAWAAKGHAAEGRWFYFGAKERIVPVASHD